MRNTITAVLLLVGSMTTQTIIPGGVPMGQNDAGTAVKRRMEQAGGQVSITTGGQGSRGTVSPRAKTVWVNRRHTRAQVEQGHSKQGINTPGPKGDALVAAETAAVYRGTSAQGTPVAVLKRGDAVRIDMEFKATDGSWCSVQRSAQGDTIGYVRCNDLRRVSAASAVTSAHAQNAVAKNAR